MSDNGLDKIDLPNEQAKEKTIESLEDLIKRYEEEKETSWDMPDRGIESIPDMPHKGVFPDYVVELNLMDNEITNPNDVTKHIVDLPNLKAFWLNSNPVVESCSNFDAIAQLMPKLEIINSKFTHEAGEWALMFYARNYGYKTLAEVE